MFSSCADRGSSTVINGIKVLNLHGSWNEMGEQYGRLAKDELADVLDYMRSSTVDSTHLSQAQSIADTLFSQYPQELRDFLKAASASSGISESDLVLANAVEYAEDSFFCSGLAVWGEYAKGALVYGRNYDCMHYSQIGRDVLITVFHPDDGSVPTAIIGYAGELYAVNAFNANGIFAELNNGMCSAGRDIHFEQPQSTTLLLTTALKAASVEDFDNLMTHTQSSSSFIIGVADSREARSYEWCYDGVRRADTQYPEGLMAMTNHYVNPEWTYPDPPDEVCWMSHTRLENMLARAEERKGGIGEMEMMEIMQRGIEEGGPMLDATRYQMVVVPSEMKIWMRICGVVDWTPIDMSGFLTSRNNR